MNYRIVFLASAEQDLKELKRYIVKNFSPQAWHSTYGKLKESIFNLKAFPLSGAIPEELAQLNITQYRQIVSGMNRVIYEARQNTIYIHIVADTRKDMKTLLIQRVLRDN
ncbi:MAG: hypothetical protein FD134_1605 [Gallionellaceae bacterium]|nr:MAG: hypothetical protein FD134_1605 [Gallionellaceae bacterium]